MDEIMVGVFETRKACPALPACAHPAVSHPAVSRPVSQSSTLPPVMHRQHALIQQHQRIFNSALSRQRSLIQRSSIQQCQSSTLPPILAHPAASRPASNATTVSQSSTLLPILHHQRALIKLPLVQRRHLLSQSSTHPPISVRSFSCRSPTTAA